MPHINVPYCRVGRELSLGTTEKICHSRHIPLVFPDLFR